MVTLLLQMAPAGEMVIFFVSVHVVCISKFQDVLPKQDFQMVSVSPPFLTHSNATN